MLPGNPYDSLAGPQLSQQAAPVFLKVERARHCIDVLLLILVVDNPDRGIGNGRRVDDRGALVRNEQACAVGAELGQHVAELFGHPGGGPAHPGGWGAEDGMRFLNDQKVPKPARFFPAADHLVEGKQQQGGHERTLLPLQIVQFHNSGAGEQLFSDPFFP